MRTNRDYLFSDNCMWCVEVRIHCESAVVYQFKVSLHRLKLVKTLKAIREIQEPAISATHTGRLRAIEAHKPVLLYLALYGKVYLFPFLRAFLSALNNCPSRIQ